MEGKQVYIEEFSFMTICRKEPVFLREEGNREILIFPMNKSENHFSFCSGILRQASERQRSGDPLPIRIQLKDEDKWHLYYYVEGEFTADSFVVHLVKAK